MSADEYIYIYISISLYLSRGSNIYIYIVSADEYIHIHIYISVSLSLVVQTYFIQAENTHKRIGCGLKCGMASPLLTLSIYLSLSLYLSISISLYLSRGSNIFYSGRKYTQKDWVWLNVRHGLPPFLSLSLYLYLPLSL